MCLLIKNRKVLLIALYYLYYVLLIIKGGIGSKNNLSMSEWAENERNSDKERNERVFFSIFSFFRILVTVKTYL